MDSTSSLQNRSAAPSLDLRAKLRGWLPLALILLLALGVRLYQLGAESLREDEGFSLRDAVSIADYNRQRPLYYLILRFWMQFGSGEAWLRLPAVFFGVGGIVLLYLIALRLADRRVALLSCLLMAVAGNEVNHSQEVRMYTLAAFLLLGAVYLLLRWMDTRALPFLVGHVVFAILALTTTAATLLGLALGGLFALCALRRERKAMWTLAAAYGLLLAVWLPFALLIKRGAAAFAESGYDPPSLYKLISAPAHILTAHLGFWGPGGFERALLGLFCLLYLGLMAAAILNRSGEPAARSARIAAAWFWGVVVLTYVEAVVGTPFWHPRYFHPIAPALYLLLAMGLVSLFRASRPAAWGAGACLFGTVFYCLALYYPTPMRQNNRGAAQWVQSQARAEDVVCLMNRDQQFLWRYYYHGTAPTVVMEPHLTPGEKVTDEMIRAFLSQIPPHRGKAWLVMLGPLPPLFNAGFYTQLEAHVKQRDPGSRKFESTAVAVLDIARGL